MARIRGAHTTPELLLEGALVAAEVSYAAQYVTSHGRVDFALLERKTLLCIDGCFFHGCPEHYVRPRSRIEFWAAKLLENVERDRRQTLALEASLWRVERVWEHEVYTACDAVLERVLGERPSADDDWRVVAVEALDAMGSKERRHLERLRDPSSKRTVEQARHTRKWRRSIHA